MDPFSLGGLGGTFWSTLIGAITGAVVGGAINLLIQWHSIRAARADRRRAKRDKDLAAAFRVMVKTIQMLSHISHIRAQVVCAKRQHGARDAADLWMNMPAFGTMPTSVEFSDADTAFLLATGERGVMLEAIELADVHNDLLNLVAAYSAHRESLTSALPVESMQGRFGAASLDQSGMLKFGPVMVKVRDLMQAIVRRSEEDYIQSKRVYESLKSYCTNRFGKDFPPLEIIGQLPD
jgi:hypothetical protein